MPLLCTQTWSLPGSRDLGSALKPRSLRFCQSSLGPSYSHPMQPSASVLKCSMSVQDPHY